MTESQGLNLFWTGHPNPLITDAFGLFVHWKHTTPSSSRHHEDRALLVAFIQLALNTPEISSKRRLVLQLMQAHLLKNHIPDALWEEYKSMYLAFQTQPQQPIPEVFYGIYLVLDGNCIEDFQVPTFPLPDLDGWFQDLEDESES